MIQTIANLPLAISGVIQDGILERNMMQALKPALLWRNLFTRHRHPGRIGERVIFTRDGLITPDSALTAARTPGNDPALVVRSVEQFQYQVKPYGKSLDIHMPSSFLAQTSRFESDTNALGFHAAQTMGRIARDALFAAYGGGNTFAPNLGSATTTLVVQDATGFDTVVVNGVPVAVSATNPGSLSIQGAANVTYTAVNLTTNTITLSANQTWSQYDSIVRSDAPLIKRQNNRTSDRLLVAGDTPAFQIFRDTAAYMRGHNVPGINGVVGGMYGCYVDPDVENALFNDAEFRQAVAAVGNTGVYAEGTIGVYAGIQFMRMPKSESKIIANAAPYQTTIHRSIMFGQDVGIEAFIPEADFESEVVSAGVARLNHFKMPLDPDAVMTMVIRAPLDKAGEIVSASWLSNVDYAIASDLAAITGTQRLKRAVLIHTAGPA